MTGIFVSYRRDDTLGVAGRLCEHLEKHFARDRIFFDMDAMQPGVDFVAQIETELSRCDALLALIGTRWLDAKDGTAQRRLNNENDFVRLEIAAALKRGIPVIPVLVDGAPMPSESDLPDDIKALARRHALELRNSRFVADTHSIVHVVRKLVGRGSNMWARPAQVAAASLACVAVGAVVWMQSGFDLVRTLARPAPPSQVTEGPAAAAAEASLAPPAILRSTKAARCQQELDSAIASAPISFPPADYTLNPEVFSTLKKVALIASKCESVLIEVQSHTDRANTGDYNMRLTERRAQAVVRYMVEAGVPAERLSPVGYGDRHPLVPNDTPENRRINRRIQFLVSDV